MTLIYFLAYLLKSISWIIKPLLFATVMFFLVSGVAYLCTGDYLASAVITLSIFSFILLAIALLDPWTIEFFRSRWRKAKEKANGN